MIRPQTLGIAAASAWIVAASLAVAQPISEQQRLLVRPDRTAHVALPRAPQLASQRSLAPVAGPFAPTSVPSLNGSPVEYLIVTSDALAPAFERLAAWKTAKGVPAVVRTLTQIEATGTHGADLAETIRLYIRDAYLYWGVRWVLLGGDTDVVPPRYATTDFLGLKDPVTDLYYACLDGDWNADGDAFYGEAYESAQNPGDDADLVAEVFVGRAPASTLAEANLLVDKTLEYERPTVSGYQSRMQFMAEVLFPTDYQPGAPISIDGATFAENLRQNLVPASLQLTRLYENDDAYPGSIPLTRAAATNALDSGYGIAVHIGHGYRYTLSAGDGSLDVGDAGGFTNDKRSGLFYMLNCTAAAYDFESFAEALLLNPHGGATLVVGSSREAFPLAASDYQYAFFRHLFVLGQRRTGETLARSREEFVDSANFGGVDRWTQLTYTLLGDPEIPLRVAEPIASLVDGMPSQITVGAQPLDLLVHDAGGPLRGAVVCVAKANEDYRVVRTDSLGHARFQFEARTAGPVQVTITAIDHRAYAATVPAAVATRTLVLGDLGLVDDGAGSGLGNNDGRIDAGETVRLGLVLRNTGTAASSAVQVTLASSDPDVTVLQPASAYPTLGAGTEAEALDPLVVRVQPGALDGRLATLTMTLGHDAVTETRTVELSLHAARPRLVGLRLDDHRAGNGNGIQDPNEVVDLFYTIANDGTGTLLQGELQLGSRDAGLDIVAGTAAIPALGPGARGETASALAVREADLGAVHRGLLVLHHLQDPLGQSRRIDLRPPAPPSAPHFLATDAVDAVHVEWTAPVADDLLGYDVYRFGPNMADSMLANADLVRSSYFRDTGLQPSTRYAYRIVALDSTLLQSPPGAERTVSTNPPQVPGWPLATNDRSSSSPAVADIDGDGQPDIAASARQVFAWHGSGAEILDADANPLTWGLFYGNNEGFGSVTLADLDPVPGKEIVVATWDKDARYVVALRRDGTPLPGWPRSLVPVAEGYRGAQVAPVVANLDHQDGPEVLLAARDGRLYGWHADGTEIADGDANPSTTGVLFDTHSPFLRCAPGVADLDPSAPGEEIVIGATNGKLYVLDAHGVPRPGWPRSTWGPGNVFSGAFTSGISIADIDRDGALEMVFVDGMSLLHALRFDGSEPAGFPVGTVRAVSQSVTPSPAIGDLVGDSRLEIVIPSSDGKLFVFDSSGTAVLPGGFIDIGALTESSPILGDVDGDPGIEIVVGDEEGVLNAWNLDGTPVDGFPITLRSEIRGTPTLAGADGDGNADLTAVTWDGVVYLWNLGVAWQPERAPWPTYRGNVHRTGEFGYVVPTPVALQDLRATVIDAGAVALRWRGVATSPGESPTWRIHRAGPFSSPPLGGPDDLTYNVPGESIGEEHGTGELEFVDRAARPGVWYAYTIGVMTLDPGIEAAETLVGRTVVHTTGLPTALRIVGNSPNPFNPQTSIRFEVPASAIASPGEVDLSLFDAHGRLVRALLRARLAAGSYTVRWDGRDVAGREAASGIYVVRLAASGRTVTHKITLVH